jgi:NAD+ kinase
MIQKAASFVCTNDESMKIYIVAKEKDAVYQAVAARFQTVENLAGCDIVVTIGGDGTILKAGISAAREAKPLLGINTGRLGFMATLEKDEKSLDKLERLKSGEYTISRRMLLDVQIGGKVYNALNDVVLHREAAARLPQFVIARKGAEIIRVRADGVIVCTATGSTAYSLSAGGPIIEPELECFLVTALSPHTLFNRPMVFSPDTQLSLRAKDVFVSVDGGDGIYLSENEKIIVTKSGYCLDLIDIDGNSFYDSIHNKLMKPLK